MDVQVNPIMRRVFFWLTKDDADNDTLRRKLETYYPRIKKKGYLSAVFISGKEDIQECSRDLLIYNKHKLAAEKELGKSKGTFCDADYIAFSQAQSNLIALQEQRRKLAEENR